MGKVTAGMILKPRYQLKVKKVDWNDPEIIEWVLQIKGLQKAILQHRKVSNETLHQTITI